MKTPSSFLTLFFSLIICNVGVAQETGRTVLPPASPEFQGKIGDNYKDSTPSLHDSP